MTAISQSGLTQTLLADGQAFTLVQMLRALSEQATLPPPGTLFAFDAMTLSFQEGVRKPAAALYRTCLQRLEAAGISAGETLHVSSRLRDDLAVAKSFGMRTALYAGDRNGFEVKKEDVQDPDLRPDRLLTDLQQLATILGIDGLGIN
ncbi:MAG: HAD family hydrolase [Planctomycetes bacterium]|nr:HAD family hydrolase [Planctomycetota bacterium]